MGRNPYRHANRLEDVIFLIQYLGLDESYSLKKGTNPHDTAPRSGTDWSAVAQDHPEFFRVEKTGSVTLALRYFLGEGERTRQPLSIDVIQKLVENAVVLQEQQAKRAEAWKTWGTLIAAILAATSGLAQLFLQLK